MSRYRVRDVQYLRDCMQSSQRVVPHSVRSLAKQVGANSTTVGYLLTGERPVVDEKIAEGIAETFGVSLEDLFLPESSTSRDEEEREISSERPAPDMDGDDPIEPEGAAT